MELGNIWATDKLALFIAFVLPGFISMQIYRLFVAGDDSDIVKKERTAERLGAKKRRGEKNRSETQANTFAGPTRAGAVIDRRATTVARHFHVDRSILYRALSKAEDSTT